MNPVSENRRININIASREELSGRLSLGPDLTEDLINYREVNGPFRIWEGLKNIEGITDNLIVEIKNCGARL